MILEEQRERFDNALRRVAELRPRIPGIGWGAPYLEGVSQALPRLWLARAPHGWAPVAEELSRLLPLRHYPGQSGVTWQVGSRGVWVQDSSRLLAIAGARAVVRALTGEPDPPCAVSSCGRRLLRWTGVRQEFGRPFERIAKGDHFYRLCIPQTPKTLPYAERYDVKSCYYSLLSKLPSPRLYLTDCGVGFMPLRSEQEQRWRKMLAAIALHKVLRNSLCGNMYAGSGKHYESGKLVVAKWRPGILRPAALLVVRSALVLCDRAARQSDAVYAYTDCVVTGKRKPSAWEDAGLSVRLEGYGEADICHLKSYRIGKEGEPGYYATKDYTGNARTGTKPSRFRDDFEPPTVPDTEARWVEWMKAA